MPFILEEDEALKTLLSEPHLVVSDERRAQRPVEVWYGQPDLELRARTYPYISIELIDINEANERVVSGIPFLTYTPSGWTDPLPDGQVPQVNSFPTPYDLDYQITAWSRHPRHDREMLRALLSGPLPMRHGRLFLAETKRVVRLDMLGGPRVADTTDESGKRLFRKVFTARVSTELFPDNALYAAGLVQSVEITATATTGRADQTDSSDFTAFSVVLGDLPTGSYDTSLYGEASFA